jgi:carbon-monoxide dehydrogenase medium subunit
LPSDSHHDLEFVDARTMGEALEALAERGEEATVLAGGTDVVVQMLQGLLRPRTLVHIRRLSELRGIVSADRTEIGALTTHWELGRNAAVQSDHQSLAEAAATVGGRQTQNVGTIAGNVVNASPAADLLPALLVANAEVRAVNSAGERSLPLEDFLLDRKRTALRPDELVTAISLERPGPRSAETYVKIGRRGAMEVALAGLAVRVRLNDDDAVADVRIAACSVGPKCFRAHDAEAALVGTTGDERAVGEAAGLLQATSTPIDDVRGTAGYRRTVLAALLQRAVARSLEAARTAEGGRTTWS